jgi:hypothetical protein
MVSLSPFFLLGGNQTAPEEFSQLAFSRCVHSNFADIHFIFE